MKLEEAIMKFIMSTSLPGREFAPKSSFMCLGLEEEFIGKKVTGGEFTMTDRRANPTIQLVIHDRLSVMPDRGVRTTFSYEGLSLKLIINFCPISAVQKENMIEQSSDRFGILPVLEARMERYMSNASIGVFSK